MFTVNVHGRKAATNFHKIHFYMHCTNLDKRVLSQKEMKHIFEA